MVLRCCTRLGILLQRQHFRWTAGVVCICCVAVLWTAATVFKQMIFQDFGYNEPLVLSYVCNGCYVLHFIFVTVGRCLGLVGPIRWHNSSEEVQQSLSEGRDIAEEGGSTQTKVVDIPGAREAVVAGLLMAPLWFGAQWTYNTGVALTSVTSSTVISATSVVWTFFASVVFIGESLSWMKVLGVLLCLGGNVATQLGDLQGGGSMNDQARGDLLCLASAVLYAAYTTVLKKLCREDTSVPLLFGTMGAAILLAGLPFMLVFYRDALSRLTPKIFVLLVINGMFDNVLSQYLWAKGVQWISPTAATVGLSLTIPMSIVADLLRKKPPTAWSYLAAVLVVGGFVSVTLSTRPPPADDGPACEGEVAACAPPSETSGGTSLGLVHE